MQHAVLVRFGDFFGQQNSFCEVFGHLARNKVALRGRHHRVFVAVFLHHVLVAGFDKSEYGLVRRVGFSYQRAGIAIDNILLRKLEFAQLYKLLFDYVLHVLDLHFVFAESFDVRDDVGNLLFVYSLQGSDLGVCFAYRLFDFAFVILDNPAVSFDDFHFPVSPSIYIFCLYYASNKSKKHKMLCQGAPIYYNILCCKCQRFSAKYF